MKRILIGLIAALLIATPTLAQEVTPPPDTGGADTIIVVPVPDEGTPPPVVVTPDDKHGEMILLGALVVSAIFSSLLLGAFVILLKAGFGLLPMWAQGLARDNRAWIETHAEEGLTRVEDLAKLTPNELDDILAKYVHTATTKALRDFFESDEGAAVIAAAVRPKD